MRLYQIHPGEKETREGMTTTTKRKIGIAVYVLAFLFQAFTVGFIFGQVHATKECTRILQEAIDHRTASKF